MGQCLPQLGRLVMGASLFPVGGSPAVCTARAVLAAVCRVGGTKTLHLSQTEGASICCCGGRGCRGSREQQSPGPPPEAIAQGPGSREDVPRPPGLEAKEALPLPELLNTGTVPRFPDPPPICSRALICPGSPGRPCPVRGSFCQRALEFKLPRFYLGIFR